MKHLIPIIVILLMVSTSFVGVSDQVEELMVNRDEMEQSVQTGNGPMDSAWPMQSFNSLHTGRSPYSTANVDGLEKWRVFEDGWIDSSPAIDENNTIYFTSTDGDLIAVYPNGTIKWVYEAGGFMTGSSPAIAEDGTIYFGSWDDFLHAINPDGSKKWKFYVGSDAISSSPNIGADGTIYFGTMGRKVFAVNSNGTEKWRYLTGSDITASPVIGCDGTVYIGSRDKSFYAFYSNGTLRWKYTTGDYVMGSASIAEDDTVYVGSFDGYLYAFYPYNGTMKWRCKVGVGTETNPSIAGDGTIYVGGNDLYAVNPNGTIKWTFDPGNQRTIQYSSPAISAEGTIYFGTNIGEVSGGEIIAVNPDGTEKWRKKISIDGWIDSSPAIGEDGTVYIGSATGHGGYLHAFGPVESNSPPEIPTISGKTDGEFGKQYQYIFRAVDPDNNPISFYIDWGDGSEGWKDERASNVKCYYRHTWNEKGDYTIRAKAKDVLGEESDWAYLEIAMPYSHNPFWWLDDLLDRFPLLQRLLEMLI